MSNNIDEEIKLVSFDPIWKALYRDEALRINKKLGNQIIEIQHIGSTAIPNIYAKPIIDIMIGIKNLEENEITIEGLIELGYEYLGEAGVPERLYFRKRNSSNFNIALCQYKGEIWDNNILFRDFLLNHPDAAANYSAVKKSALDSGADTLLSYSKIKHPFIDEIIKQEKLKEKNRI